MKNKKGVCLLFTGAVLSLAFLPTACRGGGEGAQTYTYRQMANNTPTTWSPHTWENNTDSIILNYTTIGFYDVQLNENRDGYEWVCEMASDFPEDVTQSYVGQYGVKSGEEGKVWRITLNQDATWSDGKKITADDYVYSMKELLNPKMLNRRADSYTGGSLAIFGADKYLRQQAPDYRSWLTKNAENEQFEGYLIEQPTEKAENGALKINLDGKEVDLYTTFTKPLPFFGQNSMADYYEAGYREKFYIPYTGSTDELPDYVVNSSQEGEEPVYQQDLYEKWHKRADGYGVIALTAELLSDLKAIAVNFGDDNREAWQELTFYYAGMTGSYDWENVGLKKTGEYELTLALNGGVDEFNIRYGLSSNWLVREDVYERSKTSLPSGFFTSSYCTSKETSASYGPYVLEKYVADQYFTLKQNERWYGYSDGKHEGQFQTDYIDYKIISAENAKALSKEYFMKGELDDYTVDGGEMSDFGASEFLTSTPESYTYQLFLTSVESKLSAKDTPTENHSVLSVTDFRKAISFALSRSAYCNEFSPASRPGFGVLNTMYCIDPVSGTIYRDREEAKRVSLSYAGYREEGDGWKDHNGEGYGDLESAYQSITGYDVEYSKELFRSAYQTAKSEGIYTDGQAVVIEMGTVSPASNKFKTMILSFNGYLAAALPSNTFQSITFRVKEYATEDAYWAALKDGTMDCSFSAWGGAAMDPWGVLYSCYVDPNNSNNYGFDVMAKGIPVTVEGEQFSLYDWAAWMYNKSEDAAYSSVQSNLYKKKGLFSSQSLSYKVKVLSACELAQLQSTVNIPIYYSFVNALKSAKYENGSDRYLQIIGFGGIRHISYNYTDGEWEQFVAKKGGNLESFYRG